MNARVYVYVSVVVQSGHHSLYSIMLLCFAVCFFFSFAFCGRWKLGLLFCVYVIDSGIFARTTMFKWCYCCLSQQAYTATVFYLYRCATIQSSIEFNFSVCFILCRSLFFNVFCIFPYFLFAHTISLYLLFVHLLVR